MMLQAPAHPADPSRWKLHRQSRLGSTFNAFDPASSCEHRAAGARHAAVAVKGFEQSGGLGHFVAEGFCRWLQIVAAVSCEEPVDADVCKKARKYSSIGIALEQGARENR